MRRLPVLLLAFYLVFLGGSTYYAQLFALRVAHHVLITALLLIWLIIRFVRKRGLPVTPINPLLYAAVALWLIASAFALDPRIAFESAWFPITHVLMFFFIVSLIQHGRQRVLIEITFLIGATVLMAAGVQIWTWLASWLPLLGADLRVPPIAPRLDQPFGVSTWLSAFAAPMIVIAVAWALTVSRRDYRVPLWSLAIAFVPVLILTASRGGYISLAAAVGILIVLRLWSRKSLNRLVPVAIGAVVIGIGVSAVVFLISRESSRIGGDALRTDLWRSAVEMVASDPVTGVGVGNFGRAHRVLRDATYVDDRLGTAHDVYLNTAAEIGLPGVLLWIGLIGIGGRAWLIQWRSAESDGRKLRLEAAAAALVGIGIHSIFDIFTLTSSILLPLVLIAYCMTPPRLVTDPPPKGSRWPTIAAAVIVAVYGIGLLLSDRAQGMFNTSVRDSSLADAEVARQLDPSLRLYTLQTDYLAASDPTTTLPAAISAYQDAVAWEPTWDTGWINLAALQQQAGDVAAAMTSYGRAAQISNWNNAWFGWALLAEQTRAAAPAEISAAYARAFYTPLGSAEFWNATPIRQQAVRQFLAAQPLEVQYRTLANLDPAQAAALVPAEPHTAEEWWIVGYHVFTVDQNPQGALAAFDQAIALNPARGDFYVWRAYARRGYPQGVLAPFENVDESVQTSIQRDLRIAAMLGVTYDGVEAARVDLAFTPQDRQAAEIAVVGSRIVTQNFEAVLFQGRRAQFQLLSGATAVLATETGLRIYFDLAERFTAAGDLDRAIQVYRLLLQAVPDQPRARAALDSLIAQQGNPS